MPNTRTSHITALMLAVAMAVLVPPVAAAETPKLNIKTKHGNPKEEERKQQIERQARQYDLKKYTLTREIMVEQGAINHSSPVLTLNLRFLDNDDRALSAYLHEQGHWVLMEQFRRSGNGRAMRDLYDDLKLRFPNLPVDPPQGDGGERSTYFHLAVITLEWQAMEELMGAERARAVMEFKRGDHYTAIYAAVMNNRERVAAVMKKHGVKW